MKKLIAACVLALALLCPRLASAQTFHTATITWTPVVAPSTTTYGYNIYRSATSGAETIISPLTSPNGVTCTATLCTYIDQGSTTNLLPDGATEFYYVRTVDLNSKAMSAPSLETSALVPIVIVIPPSPNNVTITIK